MDHRRDTAGTRWHYWGLMHTAALWICKYWAVSWGREGRWKVRGSRKEWGLETLPVCSLGCFEEKESVLPSTAWHYRGTTTVSVIRFWLWHTRMAWTPFGSSSGPRCSVLRMTTNQRGGGPEHNTGAVQLQVSIVLRLKMFKVWFFYFISTIYE